MTWKGTLRSLQAAQRRAERDARRKQRELAMQHKRLEKMQELERATYEVQVYENYIDILSSVHKECGNSWDWKDVHASKPPTKPSKSHNQEIVAQANLGTFKPSGLDKILKRVESKRAELVKAIENAKKADEKEYQQALKIYKQDFSDWGIVHKLASRILADDTEAYVEAIHHLDPFSEISQLGSSIEFQANENLIEVTLHVNGEDIVPKEVKTLLKSGKLSVKNMTKSKFYELYQDYVCGTVLRVARELFALLPIEMVLVTAMSTLLNTQTGYMEEKPILSVAMPKETIVSLNFDSLDPSDSMANFVHRMKFQKTKGFAPIKQISPTELQPN